MPRIRSIKPEFWDAPGHKGLDPYARLLFIAMWNWADDYGCGTANPKELAGFAFPNDDHIDSAGTRRMLACIRRAFGVILYEVGGRPYYYIPSWEKHQKVDRRSARRNPTPDQGVEWNPDSTDDSTDSTDATWSSLDQQGRSARRGLGGDSAETHESPSSPRRDVGVGTEEQRNRGTTTSPPAPPAEAPVNGTLFGTEGAPRTDDTSSRPSPKRSRRSRNPPPDENPKWREFWYEAFPRREGRIPALEAWTKAICGKGIDPDVIIAGARAYAERMRRQGTRAEKIKMAQGWINDQRWEDEEVALRPPPSPTTPIPRDRQCPVHRGQPLVGPDGCRMCETDRNVERAERTIPA